MKKLKCPICGTMNRLSKKSCYMCAGNLDESNVVEIVKSKKKLFIFILTFSFIIISILFYFILFRYNLNSQEIFQKMKSIEKINYLEICENDINEVITSNKKCDSKVYFIDNRNNNVEKNNVFLGKIETFKNEKEADYRKKELEYISNKAQELFNKDLYGEEQYYTIMENIGAGNVHMHKNCLLLLNLKLDGYQLNFYKYAFNKAVNKNIYFSGKTSENYNFTEEEKQKIDAKLEEYKKNINDSLDRNINELSKKICEVDISLDESKLEEYKIELKKFNIKYYEIKRKELENKIKDIETKINNKKIEKKKNEEKEFKNGCKSFKYQDIFRNADTLKGKMAYFEGKVIQVVEISEYSMTLRVDVTETKYKYTGASSWDDTIYVKYFNLDGVSTRILENDIIKIWGILSGVETYTSVFNVSITIPKVSAKYIELR